MSTASELSTQVLTGEGLLADFKSAVDIAKDIGQLESWVLAGRVKETVVWQAQNDPVTAERQIAATALSVLLSSQEEKNRMDELVEEARRLNLAKYIGKKATFRAVDWGVLIKFNTGANGNPDSPGKTFKREKTDDITSFYPSREVIRIGERTSLLGGFFTAFWEVHPFDKETGGPVVDIDFVDQP